MVTKSSPEVRARILAAATQAMVHVGAGGLRVDGVAADAGVNKRMIYHYFDDKEGLIQAVYSLQARRLQDGDTAMQAASRGVLRIFLSPLLATPPDAEPAQEAQAVLSPAELQRAAQILLPVLMHNPAPADAHITPAQWSAFALDMANLAFADVAAEVFGEVPGSPAFRDVSKRSLSTEKPRYRIASDSRQR